MADAITEAPAVPATTASETALPVAAPESQSAAPVTDAPVKVDEAGKEVKPSEGDAAATKEAADKAAADAAAAKPVEYTDFKLPEGLVADPEAITELKGLSKDLGLTQEQAQRVADLGAKQAQGFAAQVLQSQKDASTRWATETTTDKELGGEKLQENLAVAKKGLEAVGTPELKALLNKSGLGNHPEIIRAFFKVGKTISEDKFVSGSAGVPGGEKSAANRLYPNQK
jgi:hypothetical protein